MIFSFHSAGSLVFGRDAVQQIGTIAAERLKAKKAFIVTDQILVKVGIVAKVIEPLQQAGVAVTVFDGCVPEPPVEVILAARTMAEANRPDVVIGVGGGSNMDAAKLVAVLLAHGGTPADWVGDSRVPGPIGPMICVPTTAGTGSEVSAAAVFTDTANKIKVSTLSQYIRPAYAIVDPMLTVGCPKQVSADSGIDALTHAIEAFTAVEQAEFLRRPGGATVYQGKNPIADMMARECIALVGRFLERAVKNGNDLEARDGMAMAATLGGLAFSNAGVALVHAMEYPVGGAVHVSHGAGNGLLLPYVMRYNLTERHNEIAEIQTLLVPGSASPTAEQAIQTIERLREAIGIPLRLRDLGVTREMLPGFADKAFAIKRLMRVNPRMPQSAAEILAIYEAAF